MGDLVHVRDKDGNETFVSRRWLIRWPEDFTPVGEEHPVEETESISPTGDKKKEK